MACQFDGCDREVYAKGWCRAHYAQIDRTGTVKPLRAKTRVYDSAPPCVIGGCGRKHYARGLCSGHYAQLRRGESLRPLDERRVNRRGNGKK